MRADAGENHGHDRTPADGHEMSAVWFALRRSLRRGLRGSLTLGLLVGLAGGSVIAAAAGARRTDSAYPRFLQATEAPDVAMPLFPWLPIARFNIARVSKLPQVARATLITNYSPAEGPSVGVPADTAYTDRLKILHGRHADPSATDELVVGFTAAEHDKLHVGSTVTIRFEPREGVRLPQLTHRFKVVGITASAGDFPPLIGDVPAWASAYATPAFGKAFGARASSFNLLTLSLRHGSADVAAFERELARAVGNKGYFIFRERDHTSLVQRSIHLQVVALWLLAAMLSVATALILSQALARQAFLGSVEHPALRSLGMTTRQLMLLGLARAAAIGAIGAAIAVGISVVLSPVTPIGVARIAEPSSGFSADATILSLGIASIFVLVLLLATWPAWRAARLGGKLGPVIPGREKPSFVNRFARAGMPPTAVTGMRLALEPGRGSTALPVRTTIASVTLGIVALGVAFGFAGSLTHLSRTPRLYGANMDAHFFVDQGVSSIARELTSDPRIASFSGSSGGYPIFIGNFSIQAIAQEGTIMPPLLEGRSPSGAGADREILLGTETLHAVGARIGDVVPVRVQGSSAPPLQMRIVGRAVFPPVGSPTIGLGRGALINFGAARDLLGKVAPGEEAPIFDNELSVRFADGVDKRAAFADLQRRIDPSAHLGHPVPNDLVNFGRVDHLPAILAGGLAALAAATMAHALITSARRRKRDLAILKTLGFVHRQVRGSVAWQATTITLISLVVGLPLGLAAGRWTWTLFANRLGIVPESRVPLTALLVMIPAAIVLANLLAALPAGIAARTRAAVVLRAE
jgi:putative ABC transport system permease protein